MTLTGTVVVLLIAIVALRVLLVVWPRLFPWMRTSKIVQTLDEARAARYQNPELLAAYHRLRSPRDGECPLPERTWQDLDLDDVFASLDYAESEPGRQYLYHLLRTPTESRDRLLALERVVARLSIDDATTRQVENALRRLRDGRAARLVHLLFGNLPPRPRGWLIFPSLTAASLGCLAMLRVWPMAIVVLAGLCLVNIVAQLIYKPRVEAFIPAIHELPAFLGAARTLGAIDDAAFANEAALLRQGAAHFRSLRRATIWLMFEPEQANELVASLCMYVNILFLFDVNAFVFANRTISESNAELRRMFEAIGHLDAALSIARWRATLGQWTLPEFTAPRKALDVEDVVHPLLESPVANSLRLEDESVLITGSNMSGKTTFVRTLGVNAVLAQTLHTVCAARWMAPMLRVRSSIGRSDSILEGKSYYLAEVEAVLDLVRAKEDGSQHLFLLDELFRGTNTTERVAAGAAVLAHLDRGPDIVVIATHDIEILDLLDDAYAAKHFREQIEGDALTFDYRIQDGRSSTRNAIALLKFMEYPDALVDDALRHLDWAERRVIDPA